MALAGKGRPHRINTTGNLEQSMRANYGEHGVDNYYKQVGASYRNPHFPGVRACMFTWLERWWAHEKTTVGSRSPLIFDMACGASRSHIAPSFLSSVEISSQPGSGEVTVAAHEWWKRGFLGMEPSKQGSRYPSFQRRGHASIKAAGLVRSASGHMKWQVPDDLLIMAADPYTLEAYTERTTLPCAPLSFREISEGLLPSIVSATSIGASHVSYAGTSMDRIDMVVCSFALHLVESSSELFALLWELSAKAYWLVVLAPHKRPEIKEGWGWVKWDSESWNECSMHDRKEFVQERVHCRVYRSVNIFDPAH